MLKKIMLLFLFFLPLILFSNQGINTNDFQPPQGQQEQMQPPPPMDNNFQSQNTTSPTDLNQEFEGEAEHGSLRANEPKPNETLFDIKTTHGSILIKKLPQKTEADTQKGTDSQQKPEIKISQPLASTQVQQQK